MSTASFLENDASDQLAKRFAHLVSGYFDEPEEARTTAAQIPLENVFRLLQMFRYGAFSDETRNGVLELRGSEEQLQKVDPDERQWYVQLEQALDAAQAEVFGDTPKEQAVREVQSTLSWLATNENVPAPQVRERAKLFLQRFEAALG